MANINNWQHQHGSQRWLHHLGNKQRYSAYLANLGAPRNAATLAIIKMAINVLNIIKAFVEILQRGENPKREQEIFASKFRAQVLW